MYKKSLYQPYCKYRLMGSSLFLLFGQDKDRVLHSKPKVLGSIPSWVTSFSHIKLIACWVLMVTGSNPLPSWRVSGVEFLYYH